MDDLIKALQIFRTKFNTKWPTHCKHDVLTICGNYNKEMFTADEIAELDKLGFFWNESEDCFQSFRYGSC